MLQHWASGISMGPVSGVANNAGSRVKVLGSKICIQDRTIMLKQKSIK
jgi:hypothetical protein